MLPEDLLADLPPVRDDEPSSLRRDIADELADHLECAVRREQVKSNGADDVEHRVLERFGNPRQIARRLWWLAMWSRIMSQRVLLGVSLAGNVAAVLLSVFVALQFGNEREHLLRRLAEQRAETTEQQSALKTQLAALAAALEQVENRAAVPALPPAEPTLKVRLEGPEPGSPPPEYTQVSIKGLQLLNQALERTNGVRSERPEINFGRVMAGSYRIQVTVGSYQHTLEVSLENGDSRELVVRCPSLGAQVSPRLSSLLPEELKARGMVADAEYELLPVEVAGVTWEASRSDANRSFGRQRDSGPFLTLLGIEPAPVNEARPNFGRMPPWNEQSAPFNDPFLRSVIRFANGEVTPYGNAGTACNGMRVQMTRLILVDDVYPLRDEQQQPFQGGFGGVRGGSQQWSPAILVFDRGRLEQFPTLAEPVVLTDQPIELDLPPELLVVVRSALNRASAADAAGPVNFLRSESFRRENRRPEELRALFEGRHRVIHP
jgi:hypothetical protein